MLTDSLRDKFAAVEHAAAARIAELGLTKISEILGRVIYPLVVPALIRAMQTASLTGAAKKAEVLAALDGFYDRHLAVLDVPGPFDGMVHRSLKYLMHEGADRLIDVLVAFLRSPEAAAVLLSFQPDALKPFIPTANPAAP